MAIEVLFRISDENEAEFRMAMQQAGKNTPRDFFNFSYQLTKRVIAAAGKANATSETAKAGLKLAAGDRADIIAVEELTPTG
jgi:hypothetical protein